MNAEHIEGLERFYRLAHEANLTPHNTSIRFLDRPA